MLSMSHKSTLNIIDELVQGYATLPQTWKDKLTQDLPVWNCISCIKFDIRNVYLFKDNCEANLDDLDYENNGGLGSAVLSVLRVDIAR